MTPALWATLFAVLLIAAATGDALSRRLSNWLALSIATAFIAAAMSAGMPLSLMFLHLVTGLALALGAYVLSALGVLGGGDPKLLGAAGAWLGPSAAVLFLMMTAIAGGVLSLVLLLWVFCRYLIRRRTGGGPRGGRMAAPRVPYGCAIAAGAILALSQSWWSSTLNP